MKYKYEIEGNKVTAYCYYAGKRIQASAKCCPEDKFDANTGMLIAAKRLDYKIQFKRYKRALTLLEEATDCALCAIKNVNDKTAYFSEMENKLYALEEEYDDFIASFS